DDFESLVTQRFAGLGSGIVELAGLSDHDRTRTDDENTFQILSLGHSALFHSFHKLAEQVVRVVRAWRRFRVVLHAEDGTVFMPQSLYRAVVEIEVRDLEVLRQRVGIDRK